MKRGQASIAVQGSNNEQFTMNVVDDDVNATNRSVSVELDGDTWIVTIDGTEVSEITLAAIEGG